MADEEGDRNLPSTSEATPPQAEDSPEMVNQPSPPEDQRVTSSTDVPEPPAAASPEEPSISSTHQQPAQDVAGPSSGESALRILLLSNEAINPPRRQSQEAPIDVRMIREAFQDPDLQEMIEVAQAIAAVDAQMAPSQEIAQDPIPPCIFERRPAYLMRSDESRQFVPSESISSPRNVDLRAGSSSTEPRASGESSGSGATEGGDIGGSSPNIAIVIEEESSSGTGATENIGLTGESSTSKPSTSTPVSGTSAAQDVRIKDELSPSKTNTTAPISGTGATKNVGSGIESISPKAGTANVEGRDSQSLTPEKKPIDLMSPKRKSSCQYQHLTPKRSSPLTSPDKGLKQSESHMSTLLGDLEIEEIEDKSGSPESVFKSEQVKRMEVGEAEKSQKEAGQRSGMEIEETEEPQKDEQIKSMEVEEAEESEKEAEQGSSMETEEPQKEEQGNSMETEESEESQKEADQENDVKMHKRDASGKKQ